MVRFVSHSIVYWPSWGALVSRCNEGVKASGFSFLATSSIRRIPLTLDRQIIVCSVNLYVTETIVVTTCVGISARSSNFTVLRYVFQREISQSFIGHHGELALSLVVMKV